MTVKPTPEEVMGYADGQLDAEHARRIEQALQLYPELQAVVEDHRRTRLAAHNAFEAMAVAPMSPGLSKLAETLMARGQPAARKTTISRGAASRMASVLAWPLAAAACLVAGVVSGTFAGGSGDSLIRWRDGPTAGTELARVLEAAPSGDASANTVVIASFEASDGRFCRQFEIGLKSAGAVADGVACRGDGGWTVVALAQRPGGAGTYQAAGGGDPVALAVAGLKPGPRIDNEAERALIKKDWKR
jgi:hypothetical protein